MARPSTLPAFLCAMMLVCLIGPLSSPVTADETVDNYPEGDAWLKLELKSWEGNESEEWDSDESAPDPQFRVCVDADGDNVDCFNSPTWDNQWNLSHVWNLTFDIPDDSFIINLTIECEDNDALNDDECDMNPSGDEWKLYFEFNWTTTSEANFSGDGRNDGDDGYREAASNWTVAVSGFGDVDSDGVSDNLDICEDTQQGQEMLNESIFPGCTWEQLDSDADGVQNGDDLYPFDHNLHSHPVRGASLSDWATSQQVELVEIWCNGCYHSKPFIMDFDNDGALDIRVGGETVRGGSPLNPNNVVFSHSGADFNHDSRLDYLSDGALHLSQDDGTLSHPQGMSFGATYNNNQATVTYDFDRDGTIDIFATPDGGTARILTLTDFTLNPDGNNGDGELNFHTETIYPGTTCSASALNHGEIQPVIMYEPNSGLNVILCGTGYSSGTYSKSIFWLDNFSVVRSQEVTGVSATGGLADLNQDGWIDYIYSIDEEEDGYIKTLCNIKLGNGDTFGEAIRLGEFDCESNLYVIDLDADGDLDISSDDSISFNNNGNYEYMPMDGQPHILIDIDSDGDLDRVSSHTLNGYFGARILYNPAFPDDDADGVDDRDDLCLSTNSGAAVDAQGCSDSERDTDQDGITDDADLCGSTPSSADVDSDGCADTQKDTDGDGVSDAIDQCLETPEGSSVNLNGCAMSEIDSDTDGIVDADDDCPNTGEGNVVDSNGCADDDIVDLDGDNDGVRDSVDLCPNTSGGSVIDANGCEIIYTPPPENSGSNSNEESDSQGESDGGGFWFMFCCIIVVIGILGAIGAMQYESGSEQFAVNVQQHTPVNVQQTVVVQQPVVQPQPAYQPAPVPVQTTPTVVKETKSSQEQVVGEAVSQHGDAVTGTKIINDADAIARAAARAGVEAYRQGLSDAKQDTKPRCKSCQSPVEASWKFCVHCNEPLP